MAKYLEMNQDELSDMVADVLRKNGAGEVRITEIDPPNKYGVMVVTVIEMLNLEQLKALGEAFGDENVAVCGANKADNLEIYINIKNNNQE